MRVKCLHIVFPPDSIILFIAGTRIFQQGRIDMEENLSIFVRYATLAGKEFF